MSVLSGIRVIELAGMGPAPFAATLMSDLGADVVRVCRVAEVGHPAEPHLRGRRSIGLDLKNPRGVEVLRRLLAEADVLLDPYRPGVLEKLGLDPQTLCVDYSRLVVVRSTGWGQDGPMASSAGHDITYMALSGALFPIGPAGSPPMHPLNYVADYGGGLLVVISALAALVERTRSGTGQVVDSSMLDLCAYLTSFIHSRLSRGRWSTSRGMNMLDGSCPYYGVYEAKDGGFLAVGAVEPQFYAELLRVLGLDPAEFRQDAVEEWPRMRAAIAEIFRTRDRADWEAAFSGTEACVVPVLAPWEAPHHPHNQAHNTFADAWGTLMPSPVPRFSRGAARWSLPPAPAGAHGRDLLRALGFGEGAIDDLVADGVVGVANPESR